MTSLANAVKDALLANSQIAAIATGGVIAAKTITRENSPSSFGSVPGSLIKPTLLVLDAGGGRDPFGPVTGRLDYLTVNGYAAATTQAIAVLDDLMQRVIAALHLWQKGDTRETLLYGTRLGQVAAPLEKTVMDQLRFTVHGTLVGVSP